MNSNSRNRRVYKMTTVNLSKAAANTGDTDKLVELENRFKQLIEARARAVEASRKASIAQAAAEIAARELQQENAAFMLFAGSLDNVVATESIWPTPAFRNDSGDIILETPFSSRDTRTVTRVMHSKLADEAKDLEQRFGDMFETEEETSAE